MKKNGFTLAEVLITLAIIGVVATMTLPALMNNTAEQQYKTGLKKGINTLTEAANMNQAIDGWDFSGVSSSNTNSEDDQSLYALLSKRTSVDYHKTGTNGNKAHGGASTSSNYTMYLRDGSAVIFPSTNNTGNKTLQDDNLPYGIPIVYDTNGSKGPNQLSNCDGNTTATNTNDSGKTCTKSKRVIKDQFGLRLRGAVVVPNGAAARWAYEN